LSFLLSVFDKKSTCACGKYVFAKTFTLDSVTDISAPYRRHKKFFQQKIRPKAEAELFLTPPQKIF